MMSLQLRPLSRHVTARPSEPARHSKKGWLLHVALVVLTVGLWLLAIPAVIAWRRGKRRWALGLGAGALVALVAIGNLSANGIACEKL